MKHHTRALAAAALALGLAERRREAYSDYLARPAGGDGAAGRAESGDFPRAEIPAKIPLYSGHFHGGSVPGPHSQLQTATGG